MDWYTYTWDLSDGQTCGPWAIPFNIPVFPLLPRLDVKTPKEDGATRFPRWFDRLGLFCSA